MGNQNKDERHEMFMLFTTRVLSLHQYSTINKFSLKCRNGVYPFCVSRWVLHVLERGVSDLDLRVMVDWDDSVSMPGSVFVSKSLVRLRIEAENGAVIYVEDVFLPKVKTLHLDAVVFEDYDYWKRPVSSKTLKRLTLRCEDWNSNPDSVSLDTPNLVYFEYTDHVAKKYEIVNFDSLVEASIELRMTCEQHWHSSYGDLVGNATELLMRISNVQTLYLSANTLSVLTFCCEEILVFKNLIHLTMKTHREAGWESLRALLKNCPKLETLVFDGLHHKNTFKCKDVDGCLCRPSEDLPSFLSSSPVKVIKILKFGEISFYSDETAKQWQMEQVKYFLQAMPNREQMIVCYNTRIDEALKSQLERLARRGASSKCTVQLICDHRIEPIQRYSYVD
ncbi:unnamed protein product [Arabis nemorensis]|uniref:FBD domain-containing protein n=1 Tax=Arabis nemorensis TaxID=586526 RepID=A0A565BY11_9BRAS|nr:unnamed protein product [Arabis nemorensis]